MIGAPRSRASTLEEVAYHEAGHVVVGHRLGIDLDSVDILPDGQGGNGHTVFNVAPGVRERRDYIEAVVTTFLAGPAAEARVAGFENPEGSGYDLDAIAREWLRQLEPEPGNGYRARRAELGRRADRLVTDSWPQIETLAQALLERRRLTRADALALLADSGHSA